GGRPLTYGLAVEPVPHRLVIRDNCGESRLGHAGVTALERMAAATRSGRAKGLRADIAFISSASWYRIGGRRAARRSHTAKIVWAAGTRANGIVWSRKSVSGRCRIPVGPIDPARVVGRGVHAAGKFNVLRERNNGDLHVA